MSFVNPINMQTLDPNKPSIEVGAVIKNGGEASYGAVSADIILPEWAFIIKVGVGGDLIVEGPEGDAIPFYGMLNGDWIAVMTKKIIYQHTFDSGLQTTTAQQICWYGGQ